MVYLKLKNKNFSAKDFGGSSVWFHMYNGKKVFWMVEPTEQNLQLYEEWILNNKKGSFGDKVEKCEKIVLEEGQTILIPAG